MKINGTQHFMLFANCIPVKGHSSCLIMDLQRPGYIPIPKLLFELLCLNLKSLTINDLKQHYNNRIDKGIDKYLNYLLDKELGFLTNDPYDFPTINRTYHSPYRVLTSVINYSEKSPYNLNDVLIQLKNLGCQLIQIRLFGFNDIERIISQLNPIKRSRIKTVEIYINMEKIDIRSLKKLAKFDSRIFLNICNSNIENSNHKIIDCINIRFINNPLTPYIDEIINPSSFICNIELFMESLKYNVGLNRKVSIDLDGGIKNFVNHSIKYGNIQTEKIENIIKLKEFQGKWDINNDKIEKCKDCQYRYMCICNSDIKEINKKFSKTNTCNFNPYENTWM
ncbi:MAG: grasp-with-spasm system SPASM domain peptide maturase [Bacteroidales bacterium]|nr:grasp-with-spasm system SPASM domain peptide maturase [Bacteroidales bacterium]